MLKFELVKFEAQDVITASGVVEAPVVHCDCETGVRCQGGTGAHWYWDSANSMKRCAGVDGQHSCN